MGQAPEPMAIEAPEIHKSARLCTHQSRHENSHEGNVTFESSRQTNGSLSAGITPGLSEES